MNRTRRSCAIVTRFAVLLLCSAGSVFAQTAQPTYLDPALPLEQRVTDLLSRMTAEQKVAQLESELRRDYWRKELQRDCIGGIGPVLRSLKPEEAARLANEIQRIALAHTPLAIPVIIHDEALHGLMGNGATSFPQAIGLAATWDPELMARIGTAIGRESRTRGIRQVLSPVVNIARDVRWGRVEETYGEDPLLSSRMGVAFCRSVEAGGVIATPKHFVANAGDGGRDSYPAAFDERELREVYFPPFEACVTEGHAQSVMASYNSLDGLPCSANPWLLRTVLRSEWGFRGFVVSDYGSVSGIHNMHGVSENDTQTAKLALEAGMDVELPEASIYATPLQAGVKDGSISVAALNDAVRNVLRAKFRLGLFEHPFIDPAEAARVSDSPEHRALALQAAREAIVLLKNDRHLLPLPDSVRSIAVIGPRADEAWLGGYSGFGMRTVSILEGIKNAAGTSVRVRYDKGCEVGFGALPPIPAANLRPANGKPGEHGLRGEYFANKDLQGTPVLTRIDSTIRFEWAMSSPDTMLPSDHFSVRWTGTLVPSTTGMYRLGVSTDDGVRFWLDGRLLVDSWFDRGATLDAMTLPLDSGRTYQVKIEYYENTGWAYAALVWELQQDIRDRMAPALALAKSSDVAVVAVGITEGEGYDRANLDLPGNQEELIRAVAATGTPTVVVLVAGSAVTMRGWKDDVPAILDAWYPGEEGGNAVADVLFGRSNPGGRLPVTFPQFVGQVPLYYNHKPTGRGNDYSDMSGKPEFPFGFGLSYTTFAYSDLQCSPTRIAPDGSTTISVLVKNAGDRPGDEVVQLYLHDPVASVTRPVKELKGFRRLHLAPGDSRRVEFTIGPEQFRFLDRSLRPVVEPGTMEVMVGSSSEDVRLRTTFEIGEPRSRNRR